MSDKKKISRRKFLKLGGLSGAGLLLGVYFGFGGELVKGTAELWSESGVSPDSTGSFMPNAWLRIDKDGQVTVRINHSEMGQGITTGLAMIIAEELDADWEQVVVEIAPVESVYKNPAFNSQFTGDSTSVRTSWNILRQAGAAAREMLITAAAMTLDVSTAECEAEKGFVIHTASGQRLGYGQLVSIAAQLPIPQNATLKKPQDFTIIGRSLPRLDAKIKCSGEAIFGIDVNLPELLVATVIHPPVIGATLKSFDANEAMGMPGFHEALSIDGGVAVVAESFWQATKAAAALQIEWETPSDLISSEQIREEWRRLADTETGRAAYEKGDVTTATNAAQMIRAVYELPYQAHATPEPMNCTAHVHNGRCQIWVPTQHQDAAQEVAAKLTGLAYEDVDIYTTFLGGGYGRRINVDYVVEAVQIAQKVGKPVKVIWTRTEDMRHDFFRPGAYNVLEAGLDADGFPVTWTHKIVGPDYMAHGMPKLITSILPYAVPRLARNAASSLADRIIPIGLPGKFAKDGAGPLPYPAIAHVQVNHVDADPGVPVGFWRSVAFSKNTFVVESFVDEIAVATGQDPLALRYKLAAGNPDLQHVIQLAAEKADWGQSADGVFQGMAAINFQETFLCMVAEVSVSAAGAVKVHRMVVAVDCGVVINPKLVTAQIEGGIVFGLTAALKSQITIRDGRVEQSNFHNFQLLRMDEMPDVVVHLVASDRPPTGIGETAVPITAPAVTNAVFAATGKRIRSIPIDQEELKG